MRYAGLCASNGVDYCISWHCLCQHQRHDRDGPVRSIYRRYSCRVNREFRLLYPQRKNPAQCKCAGSCVFRIRLAFRIVGKVEDQTFDSVQALQWHAPCYGRRKPKTRPRSWDGKSILIAMPHLCDVPLTCEHPRCGLDSRIESGLRSEGTPQAPSGDRRPEEG